MEGSYVGDSFQSGKITKVANYNEEQVQRMIEEYNLTPSRETVEALAKEFNKSPK